MPFPQAERPAKYRPYRYRAAQRGRYLQLDRPPDCCRFGLCKERCLISCIATERLVSFVAGHR